jgi:hypothetical protein
MGIGGRKNTKWGDDNKGEKIADDFRWPEFDTVHDYRMRDPAAFPPLSSNLF